jgi:transposase
VLVQDESILMHDSPAIKEKKRIIKENRPIATATGSHSKTTIFGVPSKDGRQLFRQHDRFGSHSSITHLEEARRKFKEFIMFVDRAAQHRPKVVKEHLKRNEDCTRTGYFPDGSPEFNAVEECWRQGKYNTSPNCHPSFSHLKQAISRYYRTTRFNLDIKKYLLRSVN